MVTQKLDFSSVGGKRVTPAAGKFDSHTLVHFVRPSGEVTPPVLIPEGTDVADVHTALADAGFTGYRRVE